MSRRGSQSGYPPANLLLLLGCEYLENLTVLNPLVTPEHRIFDLRAQLFVPGHGSKMRPCVLAYLFYLCFLVVGKRQPGKKLSWGNVSRALSRSRLDARRRRRTGRTRLPKSQPWRRTQKKESTCDHRPFHKRDLVHTYAYAFPLLHHETLSAEVPYLHDYAIAGSHPPAAVRESHPV